MSARNILRNPITWGLVFVMAFGGWVAYFVWSSQPAESVTTTPSGIRRNLPSPESNRQVIVTADLIAKLKPGLSRIEVESMIGQPPARLVYPVAMLDGKFVYRVSYLANLDADCPKPATVPRFMISLEYEAGRSGHPLLKVHIPDPMS